MQGVTIAIGALLVALGVGSYFASDGVSVTALIPAFLGAPLVVLGLVARAPERRKMAMHIAVALGLLGFLGAAGRLVPSLIKGTGKALALGSQAAMAALCLVFVVLCVRSFVAARRK